jgi:hypothetical protein
MSALLNSYYLSLIEKLFVGQLKFLASLVTKFLCSTTPIYRWFVTHNSFNS